MERNVRLGLIGCGSIASWQHLRVAPHLPHASLVAAADPDPEARRRTEASAGIPVYEDASELLSREDVDAVIVTAPTHLHAEVGVRVCAAGKHLYLEKPLATSVEEGLRVADAARGAGVSVVVGFNRRFHPLYEQARALLREGALGPIHSVQSTFTEPASVDAMPSWKRARQTGGGVLLDLASHHLDLLRWFLADEVVSVSATVESISTEQDGASVHLALRGGAKAQSFFSCRATTSDRFDFLGEHGSLRVDRHRWGLSLRRPRRFGYGTRSAPVLPSRDLAALWANRLIRPSADPSYGRALGAFVDLVRGEDRAAPTVDDGLRAIELVEAAERSAEQGAPVELGARRAAARS